MMRQIQILPDNERMICNNYYLNLFDIARELRKKRIYSVTSKIIQKDQTYIS